MTTLVPHPIALGPIESKNIHLTVNASNLVLPDTVEQRIDEPWKQKEVEAKEKELNFFNGTSYRVNDWKFVDSQLELDLAIFDFKHRYGLITMSQNDEIDSAEIIQEAVLWERVL